MLDTDKLALEQNTAAIRCKIIVKATDTLPEIVLTDDDAIKDWTYTDDRYVPQQGFIGQFVARTLEGNLQDISEDFNIENREIELLLGILDLGSRVIQITTEDGIQLMTEDGRIFRISALDEGQTNWYSLGNFIVTNPEDDEVHDNTKFEAMDYTKLFNKKFDDTFTNDTFTESFIDKLELDENGAPTSSVTALWLAQYTCAQVGVNFPQTNFANSNFEISQSPFQAGESCREVMKAIAKLAYSWVRVGWDNNCYIDFEVNNDDDIDTLNIIDNNQYFTLETKKIVYGPINKVVVGMAGIDGESYAIQDSDSIAEHGEHAIYIYDNPLTNTFNLRVLAQQQGHRLYGLTYTQLNIETVGHPWLQGNEKVNVLNMENDSNVTYAFNKSLKYAGHIRSAISSMDESEVESTLAYTSDVIQSARTARINVDKMNGRIDLLAANVETLGGDIEEANGLIDDVKKEVLGEIDEVNKNLSDTIDDVDDKAEENKENIAATRIDVAAQGATITSVSQTQEEDSKRLNAVVAQVTSQEATISIFNKNINQETGELNVTEVTTINNYTFNKDGMHISATDTPYNATIDESGTYYRSGDEILVETTVTGSRLKNLSEQGQHRFSYNEYNNADDPNDDYDFIEERIEVEGEYAYALFYTGEE